MEQLIRGFKRQALHARRLSFAHPVSGEAMSFSADLPADLQQMIESLQKDVAQ